MQSLTDVDLYLAAYDEIETTKDAIKEDQANCNLKYLERLCLKDLGDRAKSAASTSMPPAQSKSADSTFTPPFPIQSKTVNSNSARDLSIIGSRALVECQSRPGLDMLSKGDALELVRYNSPFDSGDFYSIVLYDALPDSEETPANVGNEVMRCYSIDSSKTIYPAPNMWSSGKYYDLQSSSVENSMTLVGKDSKAEELALESYNPLASQAYLPANITPSEVVRCQPRSDFKQLSDRSFQLAIEPGSAGNAYQLFLASSTSHPGTELISCGY